ncbi:MAG TPA: phosphoribosylanthranilate isomerase [Symbiobacteriaceae bacterium]|jgi:phosphoribosylanthranilate isomerase
MWVKICGVQTMKAALAAVEAGADAVGFVFAPSRRLVTPDRAESLVFGMPESVARVGVFVDAAPAELGHVARQVGLTHLQLHGAEPPELLDELALPVIKAFRVSDAAGLERLPLYRRAAGILLDPFVPGQAGGTGQRLDAVLFRQAEAILLAAGVPLAGPAEPLTPGRPKLILAGGLTPENLCAAIAAAQPGGVDVSSGVELDGVKDIAKIYSFVGLAKGGCK